MTATAAAGRLVRMHRLLAGSPVGSSLRRDQPMASFTTYRVGGPARIMATAGSLDDLRAVADAVAAESAGAGCAPLPVMILGRGSNLLVADRGFEGLVVLLGKGLKRFRVHEPSDPGARTGSGDSGALVSAGGGVLMPVLARACSAAGARGFEWAVGVPGTVGGAARMNAGCHGSDISTVLVDAVVVDLHTGDVSARSARSLGLRYRGSGLEAHQVVAEVRLRLTPGDAGAALGEMAELVRWRRSNQPGGRNAGSAFANPRGDSAGRLIESAGVKGFRVATAEVSAKHANFIQVDPGGRSRDVLAVMVGARRRVSEVHGISLRAETRMVGFTPDELASLR